jgi:hypothetical protein
MDCALMFTWREAGSQSEYENGGKASGTKIKRCEMTGRTVGWPQHNWISNPKAVRCVCILFANTLFHLSSELTSRKMTTLT